MRWTFMLIMVAGLGSTSLSRPAAATTEALPGGSALADTLRYSVEPGQPFVTTLPARVGGERVRYRLVHAPALAWLVENALMWKTLPGERGWVPIVIERTTERAETDTLVIVVTLGPGGG